MGKTITTEVRLPKTTIDEVKAIAKLAGLSPESVIKLALATEVWRWQKVGAGETAHDWKCVSPGEYDSLYECRRCGARHMEQADRLGSDRPQFGCTYNAELTGAASRRPG